MMALAGCEADGNEEKDGFGGSAPKYDGGAWKVNDLDNTYAPGSLDNGFDLA